MGTVSKVKGCTNRLTLTALKYPCLILVETNRSSTSVDVRLLLVFFRPVYISLSLSPVVSVLKPNLINFIICYLNDDLDMFYHIMILIRHDLSCLIILMMELKGFLSICD